MHHSRKQNRILTSCLRYFLTQNLKDFNDMSEIIIKQLRVKLGLDVVKITQNYS